MIESIGKATASAGKSVVFAGTTVVLSILGLRFSGVPFVATLGYASAIVVAVSVLGALTLLPALLGLAKNHVKRRRIRRRERTRSGPGSWQRWAGIVNRHPVRVGIAALVVLCTLAVPAAFMRLGQSSDATAPPASTQRKAHDLLAAGFGPGSTGPISIVVAGLEAPATTHIVARRAAVIAGVASVTQTASGRLGVVTVVPVSAPESHAAETLVLTLRHQLRGINPGVGVYVSGPTAAFVDMSARLDGRLPLLVGVVLAVSFLLLMVAFRSLLVPLKAAVMNVLSVLASFGVITAVFQFGWFHQLVGISGPVPIISFLPMMLFAILFGLSMDYEVFLLCHIRERFLASGDSRRAVSDSIGRTGSTISSAAMIMVVVFGSFIASSDPTMKTFGLGLAVAVALDATIVRMALVPATMTLWGDRGWHLPRFLDRVVPHLDRDADRALARLVIDLRPPPELVTSAAGGGDPPPGGDLVKSPAQPAAA
jgi:RND superfamily putative drug exporter